MSDRVSPEDLADTAPDPTVDFEGWITATADRIIAELDGLQSGMSRQRFREVLILRAMTRLEQAITRQYPPKMIEFFSKSVVRSIGRWSEANECPDVRDH